MFCFFGGGLAVFSYEFIFRKKIKRKRIRRPHYKALGVSLVTLILIWFFFKPNLIYPLIISSFMGAICLWVDRKDLIKHSIIGGLSFMLIHVLLAAILFTFLTPNLLNSFFNFNNISGIVFLNVPIEEYFFAFAFGLLWAPIYEYFYGKIDVNIK